MMQIDVPAVVRSKAVSCGAQDWLDELPETVADLAATWGLTIERTYQQATEAFVAAVIQRDGTPAALKVLVPRDGDAARLEITVLRLADGHGCVRLLRDDVERGAMLLERLGPSMFDCGLPIDERHEILCATAARLWRPAHGHGLTTGAEKGRWLADHIVERWTELGRPCAERTIEHALRCAQSRIDAHDDERAVLVHGDVHQWNVLRAEDGWKLVDPDGLLAEAEYDIGIVMREDPLELMEELRDGQPMGRAHRLAAWTGLDARAIWEWGVVERVSTGLLAVAIGLEPIGSQMLATADAVALVT